MYFVLLKFSDNRAEAKAHLAAHKDWIEQGVADGVFLSVGSLVSGTGGAILAHGLDRPALEARLAADPFVRHGIVTAEIEEVAPNWTVPALDFLKAAA